MQSNTPQASVPTYFRSKSPLSQLSSSKVSASTASRANHHRPKTLTVNTSRKHIASAKSILIEDQAKNCVENSGNSLRDRIDRRLKLSNIKQKQNTNVNKIEDRLQNDSQYQRESCIRRMLFSEENLLQRQQTTTKLAQVKQNRTALRFEFQQRQIKSLTLRQQRCQLLQIQKQQRQMQECTFKPKLTKYIAR